MRTSIFLLSVTLFLQTFLFISCDKEHDDRIRFYTVESVTNEKENLIEITNLEINIGWQSSFSVKGGTGNYAIKFDHDESISIYSDPAINTVANYFVLKTHKTGTTLITATDNEGNEATLPVTVNNYSKSRTMEVAAFVIRVKDAKSLENEIADILQERWEEIQYTTFSFYYLNPMDGDIQVNTPDKKTVKGTFEYVTVNDGYDFLRMNYNNQTYSYITDLNYFSRNTGPAYDNWIQDFTDEFREAYPMYQIEQVAWRIQALHN